MGSSNKGKSSAEQGIAQAGKGITAASQMTGKETGQYEGSFDIGNILKQIMEYQQGVGQAPQGYQSPTQQYLGQTGQLGQALYNQTLQGVQDPNAVYQSALGPALQQMTDTVNTNFQKRGLLRSGLDIEQLGRSGVDLAVAEAAQRLQNRQMQMGNAQSLAGNIQNTGQTNLQNLQGLYNAQQGYGLAASGRQAQGAAQAAQYQAYPYQASLANAYGQQGQLGAGIGGALGTLGGYAVGAALAPATGGMSMMAPLMGAAVGGGAGANLGRSFF